MRILHVTDTFLPRVGGIELHVADLATHQRAAGDDVLVLTGEPMLEPERDDVGVPVERMRTGITGAGIGVKLGPVVAHFDPDVIHAHLTVGSPFTWAVLRNTAGVPTVASLHSLLPRNPALVRAGIRVTGIPTDRIRLTAVSQAAAARLRPALRPGQQVDVLHNGVDPRAWAVPHTPYDSFEILVVGRLAARKRPLVMVDALAELAASAPDLDWSATFVGDGAQRGKVAAAVRACRLDDRIRMPGALARDEIRARLGSADVLVAPATLESFGIAALEARCAGVPVVGMASSGITEFVRDGVDGLLADSDADLARCMHRLATDHDLAASIRRHNTTVPVPMAWDAVVRQHDAVYDAAIRGEAARHPDRSARLAIAAAR